MAIQSIQRAVEMLALFSLSRPRLKVAQIAKELDLPVGTAHGVVRTLVEMGLMRQDPHSKEYGLGLRLLEFGTIQMGTLEINQKAAVPARYLARDTNLVVHIGVFEWDALIVTYSTSPLMSRENRPFLGMRLPVYCTSIGRAILANLPDSDAESYLERVDRVQYTPKTLTDSRKIIEELKNTRQIGYSVVIQELLLTLCSMGAPILGANGEVVGGISLNGDPNIMQQAGFPALGQTLMETAAEISNSFGYSYEQTITNSRW